MPPGAIEWRGANAHREQLRGLLAHAGPRASLDYGAALEGLLDAPGVDDALHAAGFDEDGAACLTLGLPRQVVAGGRELRLSLLTAWCVVASRRGQGLGARSFAEAALRARRAGRDGVIWFTTRGLPTGALSAEAVASSGARPQLLGELPVLACRLRASRGPEPERRGDAAHALVEASDRETGAVGLARRVAAQESEWMTRGRPGAFAVTLDDGVVAGACVPMASAEREPCAVIELASWGVGRTSREELARRAVDAAARAGAVLACVATSRAEDEEAWRAAGMRRSAVTLEAWLATWEVRAPRGPCAIWHDAT